MDSLKYIKGYSKSYIHRFIILAWINKRDVIIKNFTKCDDTMATLNALYSDYKIIGGDLYLSACDIIHEDEFYVGESGSTLRFLIPLMLNGKTVKFHTKGRLARRPLDVYKKLILSEGGFFEINDNVITIRGILNKKSYNISAEESSQFVSGMLLASNGRYDVIYRAKNSRQYIDITNDAINMFKNNPKVVYTPVDMSNYALFYALYKKNLIEKIDKPIARCQNDKVFIDYVDKIRKVYDLKNSIDLAPMLAAYLSTVDGEFTIKGLKNLKLKESNRLREILIVLRFFDVSCNTDGKDRIFIKGSSFKKNIKGLIYVNDHRICHMALFLKYFYNAYLKIMGLKSLKKSDENIYKYFKRRQDV